MALPEFSLRQLLEAGVHFGHQTQRWDPLMESYIYGSRNGIHILDLTQTVPMLDQALNVVRETVAKGGSILFVGTKRQASSPIAEAAEKCAQYYMNHRWLGGTLTNWKTVSQSIQRLKSIDEQVASGSIEGLTKKERLGVEREHAKLKASFDGIAEMGGVPDLVFVVDVKKEALAVAEANKLGIPVVAVVDTNCSPTGVDYMIPGNDDASRAIGLYCDLISRAALDGMSAQLGAAGVDLGEMEEAPSEAVLAEAVEEEPIPEDATESTTSTTKSDSKEIADKVEVTTKKSKASAKKPKAVAKKATTSSKAKKKDDDKVSKSSSVDDKKAESDEKPAEGTA
ncbi:MAG: 30S ribosomal protein S2 [Rhodobacteraceae bacterium]|nr:MAG: 30S ribosomal protein S2 [Paracoccaceae bacterium]